MGVLLCSKVSAAMLQHYSTQRHAAPRKASADNRRRTIAATWRRKKINERCLLPLSEHIQRKPPRSWLRTTRIFDRGTDVAPAAIHDGAKLIRSQESKDEPAKLIGSTPPRPSRSPRGGCPDLGDQLLDMLVRLFLILGVHGLQLYPRDTAPSRPRSARGPTNVSYLVVRWHFGAYYSGLQ